MDGTNKPGAPSSQHQGLSEPANSASSTDCMGWPGSYSFQSLILWVPHYVSPPKPLNEPPCCTSQPKSGSLAGIQNAPLLKHSIALAFCHVAHSHFPGQGNPQLHSQALVHIPASTSSFISELFGSPSASLRSGVCPSLYRFFLVDHPPQI